MRAIRVLRRRVSFSCVLPVLLALFFLLLSLLPRPAAASDTPQLRPGEIAIFMSSSRLPFASPPPSWMPESTVALAVVVQPGPQGFHRARFRVEGTQSNAYPPQTNSSLSFLFGDLGPSVEEEGGRIADGYFAVVVPGGRSRRDACASSGPVPRLERSTSIPDSSSPPGRRKRLRWRWFTPSTPPGRRFPAMVALPPPRYLWRGPGSRRSIPTLSTPVPPSLSSFPRKGRSWSISSMRADARCGVCSKALFSRDPTSCSGMAATMEGRRWRAAFTG